MTMMMMMMVKQEVFKKPSHVRPSRWQCGEAGSKM